MVGVAVRVAVGVMDGRTKLVGVGGNVWEGFSEGCCVGIMVFGLGGVQVEGRLLRVEVALGMATVGGSVGGGNGLSAL